MGPGTLRRIELWCGLAAGVLGVLLPLYSLLFLPPGQQAGEGSGSVLIVLFPTAALVALAAFADSRSSGRGIAEVVSLPFLWTASLTLWVIVVAPYPGIDWFVLPAAILGLVAAVAGTWVELQVSHAR